MDTSFPFDLNKYFWLLALPVNTINVVWMWLRVQPNIRQNPALASGYKILIGGVFLWLTIPWLVMGIGIIFGKVAGVFAYLTPHSGNIYVLAWWLINICIQFLLSYWIFFRGGAEMLVAHPGIFNGVSNNPAAIKLYSVFLSAIMVIALIVLLLERPLAPLFSPLSAGRLSACTILVECRRPLLTSVSRTSTTLALLPGSSTRLAWSKK